MNAAQCIERANDLATTADTMLRGAPSDEARTIARDKIALAHLFVEIANARTTHGRAELETKRAL